MADISAELAAIKSAVYGEEVRDAIHDGLDKMNSDLNTAIGTQVIDRATVDSIIASEAFSLKYSNYEEIVSATDLNAIAGNPGNYWIPYNKAQTILNIPVKQAGRLFVLPGKGRGNNDDGGVQAFISSQNAGDIGMWIRGWKGYTWTSWKKLSVNDDIADLKADLSDLYIRNLFDPTDDTYIPNTYIDGNGNHVSANAYFVSNHIPASGGDKFVVTYASETGLTNARVYNSAGTRLGNITGTLSSDGKYVSYVVPNGAVAYLTFNGRTTLTEYMIVKGEDYPDVYVPGIGLKNEVSIHNNMVNDSAFLDVVNDIDNNSDKIDTINRLFSITPGGESAVTLSVGVVDSFINASTNQINSSSNFTVTSSIELDKGQTFVLTAKGYNTAVGMICLYDSSSDTYTTVVPSIDSNEHNYEYTAGEDCVIRCSYSKAVTPSAKIISTSDSSGYIDSIVDMLGIIEEGERVINPGIAVTGKFVNATQNRLNDSSNYNVHGSINLIAGQTLNAYLKGYGTTTGMICLYDSVSDAYETVVPSTDSDPHEYQYVATKNCIVRCSCAVTVSPVFRIITPITESEELETIKTDIVELQNKLEVQYPQLFDKIVFIGDSLTYGHNGNIHLEKNYPAFFEKLAQCEASNQGLTGRSAKQWWDEVGTSFDFTSFDCAIIYLGTNQGLTDTVSADCNASDYTQNADTNTGCYGKIIGKIKATNASCKIFIIAGPAEYVRRNERMNPAVRGLASFYNVSLIDLETSLLSDDGSTSSKQRLLYRPVDGIHYNVLGYCTFANLVYNSMNKIIDANLNVFKTV